MGFYNQQYWSGLPFPSPGDLPDPGIESTFPALQEESLPTELQGKLFVRTLHQDPSVLVGPLASLVAQTVKYLPAMQETWVRFLGREDPLKKEMAIHSSTLAWKIPWTEKPDRLQPMGLQRVGHD